MRNRTCENNKWKKNVLFATDISIQCKFDQIQYTLHIYNMCDAIAFNDYYYAPIKRIEKREERKKRNLLRLTFLQVDFFFSLNV